MMVAQVKADYPYRKNVRAFKTGGEEEVGKSRKEERVRSKSERERDKASIKKRANQGTTTRLIT